MQKHLSRKRVVGANGPTLRSSFVVGRFLSEDEHKVWERFVTDRHILRMLDAFTINAGILDQLVESGVDRIRYVTKSGSYTVSLPHFVSRSRVLEKFANGEDVYALKRSDWTFATWREDAPLLSAASR